MMTTSGVKSKDPNVGKTRRRGAKTGSVTLYRNPTTGTKGLPGEIGKKVEIARATTINT
jgi:hypothetical protein